MDIGAFSYGDVTTKVDQFWATTERQALAKGPAIDASAEIRSEAGGVSAGDLKPGELIYTRDHGLRPVRKVITMRPTPGVGDVITIRAHALNNERDLVLSPDHGVLFSSWQVECLFDTFEVLAPVKGLINGKSIITSRKSPSKMVQILLDEHEIIFAEGLPIESLHPLQKARVQEAANAVTPERFGLEARLRVSAVDARDLAPEA